MYKNTNVGALKISMQVYQYNSVCKIPVYVKQSKKSNKCTSMHQWMYIYQSIGLTYVNTERQPLDIKTDSWLDKTADKNRQPVNKSLISLIRVGKRSIEAPLV